MTKRQVIKALEPFADDDALMFGEATSLGTIKRICGGSQYLMPYRCILSPGHEGKCFCGCKRVFFEPETLEEQHRMAEGFRP